MSNSDHPVSITGSAPIAQSNSPIDLRALTPARVAMERTGCSIVTRHALEFSLAHAQARDAVHATLAVSSLMSALRERELAAVSVRSAVATRTEYLRRPDLGRTLSATSATLLATDPATNPGGPSFPASSERVGYSPTLLATNPGGPSFPASSERVGYSRPARTAPTPANSAALAIILADGLSALAIERHALPLLDALLAHLDSTWALTPIVIAEQARVALGDQIGAAFHADATVILIGERPGLSSPDSLGAYITWAPRPGRTDAERNCVSNIRAEGLDYTSAARKIAWFINQARRVGLTGVALRAPDAPQLP
jgi:ethanolamine ammonia-lyase small subunit